jgi:hypothetical protein
MSIDAMKQALEALEDIWGFLPTKKAWPQDQVDEAIQTLRQALAQPEHEPVAWVVFDHKNNDIVWAEEGKKLKPETPLYTAPPNQEWENVVDDALIEEVRRRGFTIRDAQISRDREWVGFTAAELEKIIPMLVQSLINHDEKIMAMLLQAILLDVEEQLKEKNT